MSIALNMYLDRTGKPHPLNEGGMPPQMAMPMPTYNPQMPPNDGS